MHSAPEPQKPLPVWRFVVPLLFQTLLILTVPAQAFFPLWLGRTVILQTAPIDPYDWLRGYSQTLSYDISLVDNLQKLPGWETLLTRIGSEKEWLESGTRFYLILEAPTEQTADNKRPKPWKAVAVSRAHPNDLPDNQVALEGIVEYSRVNYGLERYYMPEDQRDEINTQIGVLTRNSGQERPFVVEAKVDSQGNAVPVSLWIGERNYRF